MTKVIDGITNPHSETSHIDAIHTQQVDTITTEEETYDQETIPVYAQVSP